MTEIDKYDLYEKFYLLVNKMIITIHNSYISNHLNYCKYYLLNDNKIYYYPITICLGGSGFIQYNKIFKKEKLIDDIKLKSLDYDMSFSLKHVSHSNINTIIKELEQIYENLIKNFHI